MVTLLMAVGRWNGLGWNADAVGSGLASNPGMALTSAAAAGLGTIAMVAPSMIGRFVGDMFSYATTTQGQNAMRMVGQGYQMMRGNQTAALAAQGLEGPGPAQVSPVSRIEAGSYYETRCPPLPRCWGRQSKDRVRRRDYSAARVHTGEVFQNMAGQHTIRNATLCSLPLFGAQYGGKWFQPTPILSQSISTYYRTLTSGSGMTCLTNGMIQGSGSNDRETNKVLLEGCILSGHFSRGSVSPALTNVCDTIRVMLVYDRMSQGSFPDYSQILEECPSLIPPTTTRISSACFRNRSFMSRYLVVFEQAFMLRGKQDFPASSMFDLREEITFPRGLLLETTRGLGGTGTDYPDILSGSLSFFLTSDFTGIGPTASPDEIHSCSWFRMNVRLFFRDV